MKEEYTFWQSLYWHISSRRSRTVMIAAIAIVILNIPQLGLDKVSAGIISAGFVALAISLVGAISRSKPVAGEVLEAIGDPVENIMNKYTTVTSGTKETE